MRKILHINKGFSMIGGVEKYIRDIVEAHYEGVSIIDVLAISESIKPKRISLKSGTAFECERIFTFSSAPFSISFIFTFIVKSRKYDILHFHYPNPMGELLFLIFKPLLKRNIKVVTYHNDVSAEKPFSRFYNFFSKRFFASMDRILVTSSNLAKSARVLEDVQDKITIIPLGIKRNRDKGVVVSGDHKPRGEKLRVLFAGRLSRVKGVEFLLKAVNGLDIELVILGRGPEEEGLKRLSKEIKEARITFISEATDKELRSWYDWAQVFVLPSITRGEGFGYVLLEAMASSCALISTELGTGTSFANAHGETGIVVEPRNHKKLREAICLFQLDRNFLEKCSKNASERVANFSLEKMFQQLGAIYSQEENSP